jgi:hypothetical protein
LALQVHRELVDLAGQLDIGSGVGALVVDAALNGLQLISQTGEVLEQRIGFSSK